jgi:hypothetical protein
MGQQLVHEQVVVGEPCRRCGTPCSRETADVPCFEEGDTFETWKARQPAELFKALAQPPVVVVPEADIENARSAVAQALQHLLPKISPRHVFAANVAANELSALIVAITNVEIAKLAARVRELEAELAGLRGTT